MLKFFTEKIVLKTLLGVDLTSVERGIVADSLKRKYVPAIRNTLFSCTIGILPILFLDTNVIVTVLIPITMVAGTAWFSISLASMKQKFESFGIELTANMFEAFAISLGLLFLLAATSLAQSLIDPLLLLVPYTTVFELISIVIGIYIIGNVVYKIFIGSFKYDINDAMLTGQSEAAERFYRKSLSLLHTVSTNLQKDNTTQVANYYIGVAFFEIYSFIKKIGIANGKIDSLREKANKLVFNPSMSQTEADAISVELIETFLSYCVNVTSSDAEKSIEAIRDELTCFSKNKNEDQKMTDTRFSVIFQEIAELIEGQGETLFKSTHSGS